MRLKQFFSLLLFTVLLSTVQGQQLNNTSYVNQVGERVLRMEMILPVDNQTAWELFTKDDKLKRWIAPLAHVELKAGGYILKLR